MKQLSRLGIQRMIDTSGSAGSGGSGGNDISLAGYATEAWVSENYLSIEFFSKLFKAYGPAETSGDPDVEVVPNDVESTISNIKAMFGLWTDEYLSALGLGPSGGGGLSLNEPLASINTAGLSNHPATAGQTIVWNGSAWAYGTAGAGSVTSVAMSVPTGFVINGSPITSYGTLELSFATGYGLPLTADVDKGVTAYGWGNHANAGYALSSNVYSKADADGRFLTISFFRSLFKAYQSNDTTEVVPNNGDTSLISSIKAMFGLWTEQYISALGLGPSGGGGVTLNEPLASINSAGMSAPTVTGSVLMWNGSSWTYNTQSGTDTKNTAGATNNTAISLYLVGAPSQTANPETYTRTGCYIDANGYLFSGGVKVLTSAVQSVVIGASGTPISPVNGVVTLPEYPTVTDTKNTAGATDLPSVKLYLIGANGQTANPQTYTNSGCYISSDGYLYSGGSKVLTSVGNVVTTIALNGSTYSPQSGVVSLPDYPSKTSDLTNDSGFITTDTKNTAGATNNTAISLYLVGAPSQTANPETYTRTGCYIDANGYLFSGGVKVLTSAVQSVVIGASGTPISPVNGVVTLPAYPSKTSQLTNDSGFITGYTDTKNTAGATDLPSVKLYLIGANGQTANPQTYTNSGCYIGSDNCLYSGGSKVMTAASGYLPLTGGSLTGRLNVSYAGTGGNNSPIKSINTGTWSGFNWCYEGIVSSLGVDSHCVIILGKEESNLNMAHFGFCYKGSGSTSNYAAIGLYGHDDIVVVTGKEYVGIGTTTPSYKLDVSGTVYATSFKKSNGTSSEFLKADGSVDSTSYATKDTKNTAGATQNTAISLYLVGAPSQYENPETYTRSGCYISSDGYLYSGGSKVLTSSSGLVSGISVDNSIPYEPVNGIVGLPVLRLTGGSLTGKLSVSIDGSGGNKPPIASSITATFNGFNWCYEGLVPNLTVNSHSVIIIGKAESNYNMAHFGFCYKGSGSTSNYASIGLWNKDDILVATGNGYVGIGTTSPSYKLDVSGTLHASDEVRLDGKTFIGTGMTGNYKLLVNGSVVCTSLTQTSDVRNKDIIADKNIELWQVAQAPIFTFTWKDNELGYDTHVGTSAQYWKSIVPEAVQQSGNGYLGMQYDVVALLAAVTTAKKVQDHEMRIQALERENEALKNELSRLKAA